MLCLVICLREITRREPSTFTKNFIQIHGHLTLFNESLNFGLLSSRQDSHQSLGSKPVLGSLLVISLRHITKHNMSSLIDVMDDLSKVTLEILSSKTFKVSKSCWGNVSLPLQVTLALINHGSDCN